MLDIQDPLEGSTDCTGRATRLVTSGARAPCPNHRHGPPPSKLESAHSHRRRCTKVQKELPTCKQASEEAQFAQSCSILPGRPAIRSSPFFDVLVTGATPLGALRAETASYLTRAPVPPRCPWERQWHKAKRPSTATDETGCE